MKLLNETVSNATVIDKYVNQDFPTNRRDKWGSKNLKIQKEDHGWSLVNYYTRICYFSNKNPNTIFLNARKYSVTTSIIQGKIRTALHFSNKEVVEVNEDQIDLLADFGFNFRLDELKRETVRSAFEDASGRDFINNQRFVQVISKAKSK